jgi:hypothetical protein
MTSKAAPLIRGGRGREVGKFLKVVVEEDEKEDHVEEERWWWRG